MSISKARLNVFLSELDIFENNNISTKVDEPLDSYIDISTIFEDCRDRAQRKLKISVSDIYREDPLNPIFLGVSLLKILHGTGLRETAHTRLLAWFFNPNENHGFDLCLLKAFLSNISDEPWARDETIEVTAIHAERKLSDGCRRTDIWIEGKVHPFDAEQDLKWLVVVEAKVEAGQSNFQLHDYAVEANRWFENDEHKLKPLLVFLTLNFDEIQNSGDEMWRQVTFKMLSEWLWTSAKSINAPGVHLLRHYISGILSDMYGWQLPFKELDTRNDVYSMLGFLCPLKK